VLDQEQFEKKLNGLLQRQLTLEQRISVLQAICQRQAQSNRRGHRRQRRPRLKSMCVHR